MDLEEIRSRINPQYADVKGTESYERKLLCEEIETLRSELAAVTKERDELKWALIYVKQSVFEDSAAFDIAKAALDRTAPKEEV